MQVSVESVNNIERKVTIGVPAARVESEVDKRLQKAAQSARIDGFRPGKVPMKVIKKRYGVGVRQEVVGEVMRETLYEALQQEKLNPVGQPSVEPKTIEAGKDLEYIATFEVYPEITLSDLSALKVEKLSAAVEESDIDTMIEQLREQQSEMQVVDRAAQNDDEVVIDFAGTLDGEAFEGGTAENQKLVLGSNSMIEGFEAGLVGLKAGDSKVLELTFPEQYQEASLAGKAVEFAVTVHTVSEPVAAEIDAAFFEKFGVKDGGMAEFRAAVRKNMERELEKATKDRAKTEVIEALLGAHDIKVPAALIEQEVNRMRQEMAQQFGGGQQFDASQLPAELFTDQAAKRVSTGLLINQFITESGIEVSDAELDAHLDKFAESYEDPAEVISYVKQDEQQLAHFKSLALEDKVIESILEKVEIIDVSTSYEDALKPPVPAQETEEQGESSEATPS
jgi:trigger factor